MPGLALERVHEPFMHKGVFRCKVSQRYSQEYSVHDRLSWIVLQSAPGVRSGNSEVSGNGVRPSGARLANAQITYIETGKKE